MTLGVIGVIAGRGGSFRRLHFLGGLRAALGAPLSLPPHPACRSQFLRAWPELLTLFVLFHVPLLWGLCRNSASALPARPALGFEAGSPRVTGQF